MTHEPRPNHNVTFSLLATAAVAYALLQSLVAPALLEIQHDLDTTTAGVAWVLTAYLLSASVATPIAGPFGDMFGKKRTLVVVLVVLAAGTAIAAVATSLSVMIVGRVVQGAGGAVFPLAFSIIRDEFPPERVPHGIALISAIMGIGGGLGIVLAGPIVEHLSYHWLFWFPLIAVVAAAVGVVAFVPESPVRSPGRVDWIGAALLSAWLVALLVGVSEGDAWGWSSPRVLGLFAIAAAVGVVWVAAETRIAELLVEMRTMRLRGVWTTNLAAFVFGFGMFSAFVLVPEFVELPPTEFGFGASITEAGIYMLPATVAMLRWPRLRIPLANRRVALASRDRRAHLQPLVHPPRDRARLGLGDLPRDVRDGRWHRVRVRLDGEPDRGGGSPVANRRRDWDEHDREDCRRSDRSRGRGRDRRGYGDAGRHIDRARVHEAFVAAAAALAIGFVVALAVPQRRAAASLAEPAGSGARS